MIGLLFDMDGVLVHSMPLHTEAWEQYLRHLGIQVDDLEDRMHGKRNAELVKDLIGGDLLDEEIFAHGAAKERLFRELMLERGPAQYQIPGLLEFLERHKNLPMAIASNGEQPNIDFTLDQFALRTYFKTTVNGHQVERPKPFPEIYLKAARQLEVEPKDCVVFEDSPTGAQAGLAAGMTVVGVQTTADHFPGAALCIKDFLDPRLEPWLKGLL